MQAVEYFVLSASTPQIWSSTQFAHRKSKVKRRVENARRFGVWQGLRGTFHDAVRCHAGEATVGMCARMSPTSVAAALPMATSKRKNHGVCQAICARIRIPGSALRVPFQSWGRNATPRNPLWRKRGCGETLHVRRLSLYRGIGHPTKAASVLKSDAHLRPTSGRA